MGQPRLGDIATHLVPLMLWGGFNFYLIGGTGIGKTSLVRALSSQLGEGGYSPPGPDDARYPQMAMLRLHDGVEAAMIEGVSWGPPLGVRGQAVAEGGVSAVLIRARPIEALIRADQAITAQRIRQNRPFVRGRDTLILLLDEFGIASFEPQKALLKLLASSQVGEYRFRSPLTIVATGNPAEEGYHLSRQMAIPTIRRFVHIRLPDPTYDDLLAHGERVAAWLSAQRTIDPQAVRERFTRPSMDDRSVELPAEDDVKVWQLFWMSLLRRFQSEHPGGGEFEIFKHEVGMNVGPGQGIDCPATRGILPNLLGVACACGAPGWFLELLMRGVCGEGLRAKLMEYPPVQQIVEASAPKRALKISPLRHALIEARASRVQQAEDRQYQMAMFL